MATLTIRNLDERVKARLRVRAARHARSMEAEAREIIEQALGGADTGADDTERDLYEQIRRRVEAFGGVDLELPSDEPVREPPTFD